LKNINQGGHEIESDYISRWIWRKVLAIEYTRKTKTVFGDIFG
jgi:hypothetical protein